MGGFGDSLLSSLSCLLSIFLFLFFQFPLSGFGVGVFVLILEFFYIFVVLFYLREGPNPMDATLPVLLRAVHPGTIAIADFWRGLRPTVFAHYPGDR